MEFGLRPQGFVEFLPNNNHPAVLLFGKNSMKPRGRRPNSMVYIYIYIYIYILCM